LGSWEQWLAQAAHASGLVMEAMALVVIVFATLQAFVLIVAVTVQRVPMETRRTVWVRLLRYLVVGLTFQLAADIVHTTVAPDWNEIGRLAAVAVIRTFLSYFAERDMREAEGNLGGQGARAEAAR
jgi:uncharacterized membrane protein